MQKRFRSSDSNGPSRRELLLLAAGAFSATVAGAAAADAQAASIVVPPATEAVSPFSISLLQTAIDDLRHRLDSTRYPERETVGDWTQGVPLDKARALIEYWRDRYDWRRFEARANSFPHFRTRIDGLGIHFIHARSSHANALPIVFTHGWPGSFVEFMEVIGPLTEPTRFGGNAEDAFHVVIPSLPGFAFSDKPSETGWEVERIARAWAMLMHRLGYERWVAQGGDWGSGVTHTLAHLRPPGLIAAHVNWPFVFPPKMPRQPDTGGEARVRASSMVSRRAKRVLPRTSDATSNNRYAVADSAAGQALWIYEKFQAWTDNRGNPEDAFSIDAMLDDISLYWFTNTAASSARIYWENTQKGRASFSQGRIELPMAASIFPREIFCPPKEWAQALWPNLFYWNELDKGGHFAAFEQPKLFVEEMRKAFKSRRA